MTVAEQLERNRQAVVKALEAALRAQSQPGYHGKGYIEYYVKDGVVQRPIKLTQATDSLHED